MRNRRLSRDVLRLLACTALLGVQVAAAQLLTSFFPEGVPGYGTGPGVTVQSRARPEFDPLGIREGTLTMRPVLGESVGYDSNIFGASRPRGAWQIGTHPSVLLGADGSAGNVGAYFSADDYRYPGQPSQNRTDGAAFLGGTFPIGRDKLTLGGFWLSRHEDRTALDALPSDRPVAFTVINARVSYAAQFDRFTVTPSIEFNRWRFDNTTILGFPVSQTARDRTTMRTGATLGYGWMPGRDVLWVNRVLITHYDTPSPGAPSNNSTSWQTLIGVDYDDDTVWRYRLLGGVEYRQAASPLVASRTTGIAEAEITWSPTGMTTVRASASRGIEDAAQTGLSSYTYTSARITVDHEYLRNILLSASATVRHASFNQTGGQQIGVAFGVGATWLVNRYARLSLTYDFSDVRNSHLPTATVAGDYTRGLTLLNLRLGHVIPTVPLLGLDFADLTVADAAEAIAARPAGAAFGYVVTPNADHLVRLSRDPVLAGIYRDAWMRLLDSRVVGMLATACRLPVPRVAPGSDLTSLLLARHIPRGEKIAIIGMRTAWLPMLLAHRGLAEPFHYDPPMGFDNDPDALAATVAFILAHPARLVFLAVGSPRQERLAAAVAATGRATGTGLCIGASLAFLAGAERRAPPWMQRSRLEWAYRLAGDPRRLARRYLVDGPRIVPLLLRERCAARLVG